MRRYLAGALVGAITLGGAVAAWAVPASQTTLQATFQPGSAKAGTAKKPRAATLRITIKGDTKDGTGQPATSTALNIGLPPQWRLNTERWPRKARCDITEANRQKSDSVCPKGSKVGAGSAIVQGGASETGDGVTRTLIVTAHVVENGDLGFFVENKRGQTPAVALMIQGATSQRRRIAIKIPKNLQEPVTGVPTGIRLLQFRLGGTAKAKGKRIGVVETTGCAKGKWRFGLQDVYRDGRKSDSDTAKCRR